MFLINEIKLLNFFFNCQGTAADGAISKLFRGKMKSYIECINIPYNSNRIEEYYGKFNI